MAEHYTMKAAKKESLHLRFRAPTDLCRLQCRIGALPLNHA
jgi:hypothetical protein